MSGTICTRVAAVGLTVVLPAIVSVASAAEKGADDWHWSVMPYLWLISLDGEQDKHDSGAPIGGPIKLDLGAAVTGFEFGLLGHLEGRKSNWGWFVDFAYVQLELEAHVGPIKVDDIGFDGLETELAVLYRPGGPNGDFDVFGGLRYWDLNAEVPVTENRSRTENVDWTDFMVGARYTPRLSEKWALSLRGDLARASDGSDLTVDLEALAGVDVTKNGAFVFGWRYVDVKFEEGDADDVNDEDYYELHVSFTGPIVAYQFKW